MVLLMFISNGDSLLVKSDGFATTILLFLICDITTYFIGKKLK